MCSNRTFLKGVASLILAIQISAVLFCSNLFAENDEALPNSEEWSSIESNFFVIYYNPDANLENIERELKKRPLYFEQAARYGEVTPSQEICQRLDRLYNRVKDVLDMHPKTSKIVIKIFKDKDELDEESFNIFGKRGDFKAFYIYKYNTIYVSESDIEDSIMIHEMAHAVIDHYFSVIPPETVREILACYVDSHLEE